MTRDPRIVPMAGDWLTDEDWIVRVDHVARGEVFIAGWPREGPAATAMVPVAEWTAAAADAAVMVLAEDDPMQGRTVLEP